MQRYTHRMLHSTIWYWIYNYIICESRWSTQVILWVTSLDRLVILERSLLSTSILPKFGTVVLDACDQLFLNSITNLAGKFISGCPFLALLAGEFTHFFGAFHPLIRWSTWNHQPFANATWPPLAPSAAPDRWGRSYSATESGWPGETSHWTGRSWINVRKIPLW